MKINESMRQFIIDRAENLYYDGLLFPKVRRATINWICLALRLARQAGDEDLYRQICSVCNEKRKLPWNRRKLLFNRRRASRDRKAPQKGGLNGFLCASPKMSR